jgi:putative modified peptide
VPEISVNVNISQQDALRLAQRLARDDAFRESVARDPAATLAEHGIEISGDVQFSPILPPKHVVEEALVNVVEASEFASDEGFQSQDSFAFWIFVIFIGT